MEKGGISTNTCGFEGAVYLVRRNGVDGNGVGVLNGFGGECLNLHSFVVRKFWVWKGLGVKEMSTALARSRISRHEIVGSPVRKSFYSTSPDIDF